MFGRISGHVRGNVVAYLALFISLGGTTAVAAPLVQQAITGADVKNESLTGADVKDESLTGADVLNDSLTGNDILESSLGKVPSAANADNATAAGDSGKLGGQTLAQVRSGIDADKLDGIDSTGFLGVNAKAADADKLDGGLDTTTSVGTEVILGSGDTATLTVTCPGDGIALRGAERGGVQVVFSDESYTRSSYSVNAQNQSASVKTATPGVLCITGSRPPGF